MQCHKNQRSSPPSGPNSFFRHVPPTSTGNRVVLSRIPYSYPEAEVLLDSFYMCFTVT